MRSGGGGGGSVGEEMKKGEIGKRGRQGYMFSQNKRAGKNIGRESELEEWLVIRDS